MKEHKECRYLLDSLSDYIDSTLSSELCDEIERHMEDCEDCRIVVDSLRKTIYLYHETAAPLAVPDEVRARLYRRLDLEEFLEN
ncbi:MAG TPA: anti-sigma factor [Anaerolineales bacterium]|nr:anti-sigma factor [Anaerolineales bacterium]